MLKPGLPRRYKPRRARRPAELTAEEALVQPPHRSPPRKRYEHMSDVPTPANARAPSGLRRAMEDRLSSLRQAEERLQREQSALQEQAKVVFAEREARLARRERELSKREAALAVSEGIASSHASGGSDAERVHLEELRGRARRAASTSWTRASRHSPPARTSRPTRTPRRPTGRRRPRLDRELAEHRRRAHLDLAAAGRARAAPARAGRAGARRPGRAAARPRRRSALRSSPSARRA